jgi:hypothetical protein
MHPIAPAAAHGGTGAPGLNMTFHSNVMDTGFYNKITPHVQATAARMAIGTRGMAVR